jgi:hypothetical protein
MMNDIVFKKLFSEFVEEAFFLVHGEQAQKFIFELSVCSYAGR